MAGTGENETDLRKVLDLTRWAAVAVLLLHVYYFFYRVFAGWGVTASFTDRMLAGIARTGLFRSFHLSKLLSLLLMSISLLGIQGKKEPAVSARASLLMVLFAIAIYFCSAWLIELSVPQMTVFAVYVITTLAGYLLFVYGATQLSRLVRGRMPEDIFNEGNETFPQEERLMQNEYSLHFRSEYLYRSRRRSSWINIVNPFRGCIVTGTPGSGKSFFVILPAIRQFIEKGYGLFIYDFKYPDLACPAYNWLLRYSDRYAGRPAFYAINFDDPSRSHRCNPLDPMAMSDITDATEAARTILLGLSRQWIQKQGDFFVESPINFVTAIIWFLRKYDNGKFCTLPHVIELMQAEYNELLPVLNTEPEIEVLVNPFIKAYQNDVMEQLEGQIASAKIAMARLASPQLYWVLSGNDFTLDINDPKQPKIICAGNNPEKKDIYGAALSLYVSRVVKVVNKKDRQKSALVFDEFPTIFFNNMDSLIATARSNKVATMLGIQDFSQLRKDYGRELADVIVNICGNIISGQVMGDSARLLSERFGRINQDRESLSINRTDTSISRSKQLESAIPASRIASLSSGEFVGMVADDPFEKIRLKMFHANIVQNTAAINEEAKAFQPIPSVRPVTQQQVQDNFFQVKYDVRDLIAREIRNLKIRKTERQQETENRKQ